jgi:hypothetical protein
MSLWESTQFQEHWNSVRESITEAGDKAQVGLSPFVFETIHTWTLALIFEGPTPTEPLVDADRAGEEVASELISQLPRLMRSIADFNDIWSRQPERQRVITSADLFHWLTERGGEELAFIRWPYPKD